MSDTAGTATEGVQPDEPQVEPAPQGSTEFEGLGDIDIRGLGESLRPQPTQEPPEAASSEDDDGADEDAEPNTDGDPAPQGAQRTAADWAEILKDAPQRINEVPGKLRGEAVRLHREAADRRAADAERAAFERGRAAAAQLTRWEAGVKEIDDFREQDPEGYGKWVAQYPDRYQGYLQAKQALDRAGRQEAAAGTMAEAIAAKARDILQPLRDNPDAVERLAARDYPMDLDGLARLSADVAQELAEARNRAEGAPARAREQAAAEQRGKPRPVVTGGAGSGELTAAALRAMKPEEVLKIMQTEGGEERINRALASR